MKFTFVIPDMKWLWNYKTQFSLGVLYLSTQLKKVGWDVDIFDSNDKFVDDIPYADVFGFSTVYNTYLSSVVLAKQIKMKHSNSKLVVGGVHPTTMAYNIDPIFDTIFIGQSELTIMKYVQDLLTGKPEKHYVSNGIGNLDDYYPDRTILPPDYLKTPSIFSGNKTYTSSGSTAIMFSRGCPYKCRFCSSPVIYKTVTYRGVDNIIAEIKSVIANYGIRQFRVQDDTFTASKTFIKELTDKLTPLDIYYRCSTRVNHLTEDVVQRLYNSGCREIGLGVEVADNDALKLLNKGITVEQAERAIAIGKKFPIMMRGFFMMGLPTDSIKTMQANIDFIERTQLDNVIVGKFIPFPGNDMYINMLKYNIKAVKPETCMNIARTDSISPNILRTDISEKEHGKIMQVFLNYLIKREFI